MRTCLPAHRIIQSDPVADVAFHQVRVTGISPSGDLIAGLADIRHCGYRVVGRFRGPPGTSSITVVIYDMAISHSKVTAQGQISVPADVRKKLGVGPGSVLEWDEQDDHVVVRRAGRYTSEDVNRALFPDGGGLRGPEVKDAIRKYVRKRHARS